LNVNATSIYLRRNLLLEVNLVSGAAQAEGTDERMEAHGEDEEGHVAGCTTVGGQDDRIR
jgi:hypothetical protein